MAKRKAGKNLPSGKSSDVVETTVTWRNTFNCDKSTVQAMDRNVAAAIARQAGYDFMAYNHKVFLLRPDEGPEALGYDAETLDVGLIARHQDMKLLDVRKRPNTKYLVTRISYQYDDERYNREEGSFPKVVFDTKEEAETEARKLTIAEAVNSGDPFEYMGESYEYDECVAIPYHAWFDWLKEQNIDPPTEDSGDEPDMDRLRGWWLTGVGAMAWSNGSYKKTGGTWSKEQCLAAATHLSLDFYEVAEIPYGLA